MISLEFARRSASLVEARAKEMGLPATICVLDTAGHVVLKERMTGAGVLSLEMAELKAYTSALLGMATADLPPLVQPGQPLYGITSASGGKLVAFGGGVPLLDGDTLVGGLGVSAGTIDQDITLANAALE